MGTACASPKAPACGPTRAERARMLLQTLQKLGFHLSMAASTPKTPLKTATRRPGPPARALRTALLFTGVVGALKKGILGEFW